MIAHETFCKRSLRCAGGVELNRDRYDVVWQHILIEDRSSGGLVCCFRILPISDTMPINASYSAQFYQLSALKKFQGRMVEMGRFCIASAIKDPDILRLAWAVMSRYVAQNNICLLFGYSSFAGPDTGRYLDAFALLRARYLAPARWRPREKAPDVFRFAARLGRSPDMKLAMARLPSLLKTYLMMGAGSVIMPCRIIRWIHCMFLPGSKSGRFQSHASGCCAPLRNDRTALTFGVWRGSGGYGTHTFITTQ